MPQYDAVMRVVHLETWSVEADTEAEARTMLQELHLCVATDETGGEIIDWEVQSISPAPQS